MHHQISDNEIYLLIKYIKCLLWRVVERLSLYTGRTVPKFKPRERAFKQFKSPVLNVLKILLTVISKRIDRHFKSHLLLPRKHLNIDYNNVYLLLNFTSCNSSP